MRRGPKRVILDEKLADWSAAYLAMWNALESFDPQADRWSEPVSFGDREERIRAAQNAISRVKQRYGPDAERECDIQRFHEHVKRLANGASYGAEVAQFTRRVRQAGSSLADASVVASGAAGVDR